MTPLRHSTAPYTFVPFGPTVTAGDLWGSTGDDLTAAFDRPVPGTLSGHIDVRLTALSPFHLGDHKKSATSFRWPDDAYGIPGPSLHGALRGVLGCILGGDLGPVPDRRIFWRAPVIAREAPESQQAVHRWYRAKRGDAAQPGAQRIGLLRRNPTGEYTVHECVQHRLRAWNAKKQAWKSFYQVPRIRRTVLQADLGIGELTPESLREHQWQRMYVVWARISTVTDDRERVNRPIAFAIGRTRYDAEHCARIRAKAGPAGLLATVPAERDPAFLAFLAGGGTVSEPEAEAMLLVATGLQSEGTAEGVYLFPLPGWGIADELNDEFRPTTLPVQVEAVAALRGQRTEYQENAWPAIERSIAPDGVPVFFDSETDPATGADTVVRLGTSGGFRVEASRSLYDVLGTVPRVSALDADRTRVDAVRALLGDTAGSAADTRGDAIKGRVAVGHARQVGDVSTLVPADPALHTVALLQPEIGAWHLRLHNPPDAEQNRVGYDNPAACYRGREVYHHRWDAGTTWEQAVRDHQSIQPENASTDNPDVGRIVHPLAPGTTFTARITVTNLAPAELGALLFALRLGNSRPSPDGPWSQDFAHRLGGLKPLGAGSIHLDAQLHLHPLDRYRTWNPPAPASADEVRYIDTFLAAIGAAPGDRASDWVEVPETGRAWPPHLAALLLAARWTERLPRAATREMPIADHAQRAAAADVFTLHAVTPQAR